MVVVHVWEYRGKHEAWGHASMTLPRDYISWWPQHPGHVPAALPRTVSKLGLSPGLLANLYTSHPIRERTFRQDSDAEGGSPDHNVTLAGLNEEAITQWWSSFGLSLHGKQLQGPMLPWSTLSQNCSSVVAKALQVAGGDTYASWTKAWNVVWTPKDVLGYARSIEGGLARAGRG